MQLSQLKNKQIAIYGFGQEGQSVYRFLSAHLAVENISILNDTPLNNPPANSPCYIADEIEQQLPHFDVVVKSPGVSLYKPSIIAAKKAGVYFTSLVNLWFAQHPDAVTVCITGSKGKSTTSSLLTHILRANGVNAVLGGNVGQALFDLPAHADVFVIELSSYQTSDLIAQPSISAILNLFPEHLDWHQSVDNYYRDKCQLLAQTKKKWLLNANDKTLQQQIKNLPVADNVHYFNQTTGFHFDQQGIYYQQQLLLKKAQTPLLGEHNQSNICAALALAQLLEYSYHALVSDITTFCTLKHRLNFLGKRHHLSYIDDSISTTPQSVVAALKAYSNQTITVLVGGYDRGLDWQVLVDYLPQAHVHAVITMPQNGKKIQQCLQNHKQNAKGFLLKNSKNLAQAVKIAQEITPKGGYILLSPGAPSYGLYNNFKQRGHAFKQHSGLHDKKQ